MQSCCYWVYSNSCTHPRLLIRDVYLGEKLSGWGKSQITPHPATLQLLVLKLHLRESLFWPLAGAVITKHIDRFVGIKPSLCPEGISNTVSAEHVIWTFLGGRDEGSFKNVKSRLGSWHFQTFFGLCPRLLFSLCSLTRPFPHIAGSFLTKSELCNKFRHAVKLSISESPEQLLSHSALTYGKVFSHHVLTRDFP